jgi:hypothetical protein
MSRKNVIVVNEPRRKVTVVGDPSKPKSVVVKGALSRLVAITGAYIPRADLFGGTTIAGVPVEFTELQVNNLIAYNGQKFINRAQELLTDGGNF